jgi:DNA-binding NarL/FixJ family response regulator
MYSTLLVDDHALFREGLHGLIDQWEDFEVVGEATNGIEALDFCAKNIPDLVLMDIAMPGMGGLEATLEIRKSFPSTHIVMLTVSEEEQDLFDALRIGANGYVLKNTPSQRFRDMLRGVMKGEAALSGQVATRIFAEFSSGGNERTFKSNETKDQLTSREMDILSCVAEGLSNKEISEKLFMSEATIKKYLGNLLEKLHLKNRVQAAVFAVKNGLDQEE